MEIEPRGENICRLAPWNPETELPLAALKTLLTVLNSNYLVFGALADIMGDNV